jgi:hypothetical protein
VVIANTQDYRRVTGDLSSYDGDVMDALVDAQNEFLNQTGRKIELGTYTEDLPVYDDGRVYPSATPVTGVLDPPDATHDTISIAVAAAPGTLAAAAYGWPGYYPAYGGYAYGAYTGGYQPIPADVLVGVDRAAPMPVRTVSYTGGYAPPPSDVIRCVCEMTLYTLHPDFGLDLPVGTKSVTLGDQSITGSFGATTQYPSSVTRVIAKYTRTDP